MYGALSTRLKLKGKVRMVAPKSTQTSVVGIITYMYKVHPYAFQATHDLSFNHRDGATKMVANTNKHVHQNSH